MHRVRRPSLLRLVAVLVAVAGACRGQEEDAWRQLIKETLDTVLGEVNVNNGFIVDSISLGSQNLNLISEVHANLTDRLDKLQTHFENLTSNIDGESLHKLANQVNELSSKISLISRKTFPRDCSDLPALSGSCIYELQPGPGDSQPPTSAYCDQDTDGGGWTVIQRRNADIKPRENFNRDWASYRKGFGSLTGEFWWGLQNLWMLTWSPDRNYELRVDMEDFDGETRYAVYDSFRITSECDGYRLILGNYTGTGNAGDSLNRSNGTKFTTKDRDNDEYRLNCSRYRKGGFWFNKYCTNTNLNGEHYSGPKKNTWEDKAVVTWLKFRGPYHSLKKVEVKVRPTGK